MQPIRITFTDEEKASMAANAAKVAEAFRVMGESFARVAPELSRSLAAIGELRVSSGSSLDDSTRQPE